MGHVENLVWDVTAAEGLTHLFHYCDSDLAVQIIVAFVEDCRVSVIFYYGLNRNSTGTAVVIPTRRKLEVCFVPWRR